MVKGNVLAKNLGKQNRGMEPVCWWCKTTLPFDSQWRGKDLSLGLPIEVGVFVCGPNCPKEPEGAIAYTHESFLRGGLT